MQQQTSSPGHNQDLPVVLGYLNFSSGAPDARFLSSLNRLWANELAQEKRPAPIWRIVGENLRQAIGPLAAGSAAFENTAQVAEVLRLVTDELIPGYLQFHADLLFHQTDDDVINSFFFGRVCEAALKQGPPWEETKRIRSGAISQLSDFVGYRPVPALETRRTEVYPHERIRPVPLYIRGAGVAVGRYRSVVETALELLQSTDEDLLRAACFDPKLLDELAFDPREYDFDHPVNKRPNYHFGLWDPHQLDGQGRYRRFVVQQVTLNALMRRFDGTDPRSAPEILFEAAAVLAGTILMASGVSGGSPETYDSSTTLASLLPRIAGYRDVFYQRLLERTTAEHAERLRQEAIDRRQPFGGARQHLNAELAKRRASQLEHVQLAKVYARMGYPEAAAEQASAVPVASARIICQIECRLTAASDLLGKGQPAQAANLLSEIIALLRKGIQCGAVVDPWSILGFDAQFSLFPALENSVHDHRVDELVAIVEQIFASYERIWSAAAARDDRELCERVRTEFHEFASWWRQFAAHEVSQIDAIDAFAAYEAAEHVARALNVWHKKGAATGHVGFWASHAEMFDSPQAYALVIEALLDQSDFVAAMGLLVHWLGASDRIPLEQGDSSFPRLAERWLLQLQDHATRSRGDAAQPGSSRIDSGTWSQMRKFLDYIEANAGGWWKVPTWQLGSGAPPRNAPDRKSGKQEPADDDEDEGEDLFRAAYENVVYQDSADDGMEGPIFDGGIPSDDELVREGERVSAHLAFLNMLSHLWRVAALSPLAETDSPAEVVQDRIRAIRRWAQRARQNRRDLMALLDTVQGYRIPAPFGDHESMLEYDRRRVIKESVLERIIVTCVETAETDRLLMAAVSAMPPATEEGDDLAKLPQSDSELPEDERLAIAVFAAGLRGETDEIPGLVASLISVLSGKPLLYVPLTKGGNPRAIVETRVRQRCMQDLLKCLPRLGLLTDTFRLIETAREMERSHPVGPGAVTEFDEVFKIGWTALVESLVVSAQSWGHPDPDECVGPSSTPQLVSSLKRLTEVLLVSWLAHSHTLRLSVLEKVSERHAWKRLVEFIEAYGEDLFTQRFLNLGNLRAILHQGVDEWLSQLAKVNLEGMQFRLLDEIDEKIPRREAVERLTLVLESVVENYGEYRDYNSTTTQSDRGQMLYTLLDFLRLRANYDRICWNLRPIVIAHEILVRHGCKRAAQQWRRALRERIKDEADKYESRLAALQKKYSMLMPTVADRLSERFVRPLVIDRIRALVAPAVAESQRSGPRPTFRLLQYETEFLMQQPSGVGFDVPAWLAALEEEVQRVKLPAYEQSDQDELRAAIPVIKLKHEEIRRQIDEWAAR
jgi:hypothetical protein